MKQIMKEEFVTDIQKVLIEEKKRLEKELGNFAQKNSKAKTEDFDTTFPEYGDDEDENANEIATYSNNLALERELEKSLRDVNNAIQRISDKTYGVCKYCKSKITEPRLKARPTSTSCIACKKTLTQEM